MYISSGFDTITLESDEVTWDIIRHYGLYYYILVSQSLTILIPAILAILIFHYREGVQWVKFKFPIYPFFFVLGIILLFCSYPLIQFSADINSRLPVADWLKDSGLIADKITKILLTIDSPEKFINRLLLLGLLPAISEELFFRVGIQNEFIAGFRNKDVAIVLTAIIFSALHFQFDGFLPRFFLGLILGYSYYWSGSILVSILIHFANNATLLISAFMMNGRLEELTTNGFERIPTYILVLSMISVFLIRFQMIRLFEESKLVKSQNN